MKNQNKNKIFRSLRRHFSMVSARVSGMNKMPSSDNEVAAGRPSARGKFYFCFGFFLVAYFLLFAAAANAQFELPSIGSVKPAIILNSDPLTPLPNSTVAITANLSGIIGVGNSNYVWFLNGARQTGASGQNRNTFTFPVGDLGAIYKVGVSVLTPKGDNLSDSISLTVSNFDLTWSTSSQAPVSYKGKPLPTQNSIVNVSALPFIYRPGTKTFIANNNLIFNWRVDDKFVTDKSGAGKSNFLLTIRDFAGANKSVRLEIKTPDNAVSLTKSAIIPIVRPQTLIYFADPKTDLPYGAALKNLIIKPISLNFVAQNYFFNAPAKDLKWQWFINNKEVTGKGDKPWLASLNLSNINQLFSAQVQVLAKNPANDLETAQSTINLEIK